MIRATYIMQWFSTAMFAFAVGFGIYTIATGGSATVWVLLAITFAAQFFTWGLNRKTELARRETKRRLARGPGSFHPYY